MKVYGSMVLSFCCVRYAWAFAPTKCSAVALYNRGLLFEEAPSGRLLFQAKHAAVAEALGREVRVLKTLEAPPRKDAALDAFDEEELDDFYDLTTEDYYKLLAVGAGGKHNVMKGERVQEVAARREMIISETIIRVCFPDGYSLEVKFQSSEKIQSLVDLLMEVVAQPNLPFYLYTTPRKLIEDFSKEFCSAGFTGGAIIRFSYDLPKGFDCSDTVEGPYLREDILALDELHDSQEQIAFEINDSVLKLSTHPTARGLAVKSTKQK